MQDEPLGLVRLRDAEQFVQPPHLLGQLGRGEDPAAAQAGKAVDLGQARRADEAVAERSGGPLPRNCGIEIDLVDQDMRRRSRRDRPERRLIGEIAGGIVKIGEDDQPGGSGAVDRLGIDRESRARAE